MKSQREKAHSVHMLRLVLMLYAHPLKLPHTCFSPRSVSMNTVHESSYLSPVMGFIGLSVKRLILYSILILRINDVFSISAGSI